MNLNKAIARDNKIHKRKNGMQVDNRSIFTIEEEKIKRSLEIKKKREEKEKLLNSDEKEKE